MRDHYLPKKYRSMELIMEDVGMELPSYNPTLLLEEPSKITKKFSYYSCQPNQYSNRVLQEHTLDR
jgi:hypothetical protein